MKAPSRTRPITAGRAARKIAAIACSESLRCVIRSARLSSSSVGNAPESDLRGRVHDLYLKFGTEPLRQQPLARAATIPISAADRFSRRASVDPSRGLPCEVEPQGRLQRREDYLVASERPLERIGLELFDERASAHDDSGLRSTQQFVAGKSDDRGARCDSLAYDRFARQAIAAHIDKRPRPRSSITSTLCARPISTTSGTG